MTCWRNIYYISPDRHHGYFVYGRDQVEVHWHETRVQAIAWLNYLVNRNYGPSTGISFE